MSARSIGARLLLGGVLALPTGVAASAPGGAPPAAAPIVFITIDTLRADHLGCYGYFRDTSPIIDRLAEEGLLFENAVTTMATTLPAHTSLMTSSYTVRHGVLSNLRQYRQPVATSRTFRTAAQMFRRAGYRTAAFVSSNVLSPETGIAIGFDTFDAPKEKLRNALKTSRLAADWMNSQEDGRYFLWVHFFDPHDPYSPPPHYRSLFTADDRLRDFLRRTGVSEQHWPVALPANDLYDGEIRFVDHEIGRLFRALRGRDLYEASLIVLAADHGEGLGQHDEMRHGVIFNEQIDIPLIVRFPAGLEMAPRRVDRLVSLIDILPMITEELDLPLDEEQFDGVNPLRDERADALAEREHSRGRYGTNVNYVLRTARWKYFFFSEEEDVLFDLRDDYHEIHNVIAQYPEVARRLRDELLRQVSLYRERGAGLEVRRDISPEVREQLESLGYVD